MEYKVLYRKYRPENFDNIVDQDVIIKTLKNAISSNKISHAYLFSGPRGTGKTSTAKVFAKALNCEHYNDGPCNKCESCLNSANNPDIIEIDAASNNGVDDVRELINNVKLAPSMSKYKVYIIDEVHMLTTNAFNALLLTLEEPPSNVVFIMATTNVESVPITILSRCQRFDFKQISMPALIERVKYVCKNEKIKIDDDAVEEICALSEGGLRDALSILDQLSSQNDKITLDIVQNSYRIVNNKVIKEIIDNFNDNDTDNIISIISDIESKGYDFKTVIKRIINAFYQYINDNSVDDLNKYKNLIMDLNKLINEVNIYVSPYILLKTLFITSSNITNKKEKTYVTEIKDEPKELEKEIPLKEEEYFPGNTQLYNDLKDIRINNTFVNPKKEYLKEIKEVWKDFLKLLKNKNVLSLLVDSDIVVCSDTNAIITTEIEATSHLINASIRAIEDEFEKNAGKRMAFIAVSNEEWNEIKDEYVKNKKKNKKYEYIEEEKPNDDELSKIANELFDKDKIEME